MTARFAIMRVETTGFSTLGPTSKFLNLDDAKLQLTRLKRDFPHQIFMIVGEVGIAFRSDEVTVTITSPIHDETPLPWPKRSQH